MAAGAAAGSSGFANLPTSGPAATRAAREPTATAISATRQQEMNRPRVTPMSIKAGTRKLVVLEMPGGNDALSMAVPYGVGAYYDHRKQTAIAQADVLAIDNTVGLHPHLTKLAARGITLVEGLGSMTPDGSHFEMQARWWAGDSKAGPATTGWVGRLADVLNDGAIPATAVSVGQGAHPIIRSASGATLAMPSADSVWALAGADPDDDFQVAYQAALRGFAGSSSVHGSILRQTIDFAEAIVDLDPAEDCESTGYNDYGLGASLQFAAQLLADGTGVRVVHVSMDGDFDTHEGHSWKHSELMQELDTNLAAFHNDLDARGLGDDVMVMTTSEFGRTLNENSSGGLDHGTAATAFLSGPGTGSSGSSMRLGNLPSLTRLDENGDLQATLPFESYLAGVVEGWLGVPASEVFGKAEPLQLFT